MHQSKKIFITIIAVFIWCSASADSSSSVKVEFTEVPKAGAGSDSQGNIAGVVKGISTPQKYKIVLYAHTDWWYVQPLTADPFTNISTNGSWSNWTHLGYRYAALVVRDSFQPRAKIK